MSLIPRVNITHEAARVVERLREKHGELMFHQSGGCCDGSSPMCFPKGEFIVGSGDVWLGEVPRVTLNADQVYVKMDFEMFV
jgi:uncharacterized protein (DUF779 family)